MGLPKNVSDAIADAMRPQSDRRTQAITALTSQLMQSGMTHTAVYDTNRMPRKSARQTPPPAQQPKNGARRGGTGKYVLITTILTVLVLLGVIVVVMVNDPGIFFPNPPAGSASESAPESELSSQPEEDKTVPRFVGERADDVTRDSRYEERFEFSIKPAYNDIYDEGVIFDQSPVEGTLMPEKGVVILHVSKGPEKVEMPDLLGLSLEEAVMILDSLNLDLPYEVFERVDRYAEPGSVLRTTPEAGAEMDPRRQRVYLFVAPESSQVESSEPPHSSSSTSSSRGSSESLPFSFWE